MTKLKVIIVYFGLAIMGLLLIANHPGRAIQFMNYFYFVLIFLALLGLRKT